MLNNWQHSSDLPQGGLELPCILVFTTTCVELNQITKEITLSVKVHEGTSDADGKTDTGTNMVVDLNSQANSFSSDCNDVTCAKLAGSQVKEEPDGEPDKLPEVEVDLTTTVENESPVKKKTKLFDSERIIMGQELTDNTINLAQHLLKGQFPTLKGLQSTLYQQKEQNLSENDVHNKLQIVHCKSCHHWIVATTVGCRLGQVKVYDSSFTYCNKETTCVIENLFYPRTSCLKPTITMSRCQKQKGGADCGLFAIANATAITFGKNPCKLQFIQASLSTHLVDCFQNKLMSPQFSL